MKQESNEYSDVDMGMEEDAETAVSSARSSDTSPLTMVRESAQAEESEQALIETRILTPKKVNTAPLGTPHLGSAQISHLGAIRERNEDSCLAFTAQIAGHFQQLPFGLYMVADGMGGHMNGHEASNLAIRIASHHIISNLYLPILQDANSPLHIPVQEVLVQAVEKANDAVYSPDPEMDGGTTLTIALVLGRRLHIAHVGDSRTYLLRDEELEQITDDHSLVRHLQDVGQLSGDDELLQNMRHVVLRAVGQGDELEVDTYTLRLPANGRLLLCSDGLSGMITDGEIEEILRQADSVTKTADTLCETALKAGGHDNITAVVVDFDFE